MNYIGRKDNGKYISSSTERIEVDPKYLKTIAYDADIAAIAKQQGIKYREAFQNANG